MAKVSHSPPALSLPAQLKHVPRGHVVTGPCLMVRCFLEEPLQLSQCLELQLLRGISATWGCMGEEG